MTKLQAYFPDDLYLELKLQAKRENVNFSQLLRTISKNYLAKKVKVNPLAKIKPMKVENDLFKGLKPHEISKKIDEIVYG
jgi:hypothetical protein